MILYLSKDAACAQRFSKMQISIVYTLITFQGFNITEALSLSLSLALT